MDNSFDDKNLFFVNYTPEQHPDIGNGMIVLVELDSW